MKVYQFINRRAEAEYLVFVEDDDDSPVEDYARRGFELYAQEKGVELGIVVPGTGDCYMRGGAPR